MKKFMMPAILALIALALTGCGSYRTPPTGKNKDLTYYHTFFGISLESAVYGDGLVVNPMSNK